jgi:threonine dehydrogenase-like Zn-dependent dehydrogenase
VEAAGPGTDGWRPGDRVYGDTYAGYAEYAVLRAAAGGWSAGAVRVDDGLDIERAVFVEPLADCLHAVVDQGRAGPGDRVLVLGAGQMGLQLVAAAAGAGAEVLVVEPLAERRELARAFGAGLVAGAARWEEAAQAFAPTVALLSVGDAELVMPLVEAVEPGGRVVLFAGFGDRPLATLDLNRIHYREVAVVGSEWIGTPPNVRLERYAEAAALLASGRVPVERLVTARCGLDGLGEAFAAVQERRGLKTVLLPWGA